MIELLPYFVAGTALCTIGAGAIVAALAKGPLIRLLSGNRAVRLPFRALCSVAMGEVAITAISCLVALAKLGSGPPATEASPLPLVGALFIASGLLAWVVNLLPNLYLLGRASDGVERGARAVLQPGYALVLALQTPLFTIVLLALLYLGLR